MQVKVIFMSSTKSAACCTISKGRDVKYVRWVEKLIENMDISLKFQCNRSSNRPLLPYRDIHWSEMDYQKIKCRAGIWF